jgi:hydroxybutyrate-dimer hydrolase
MYLVAAMSSPTCAQDLDSANEAAVRAATAKVAPSIVLIETSGGSDRIGAGPGQIRKGVGPTSGLVVAADGYVISSAFNFANKPTSITVSVPGREYQTFARVTGAQSPHRILVQIPDAFDAKARCLVVTASSGSRGIYGAISAVGEWGLKQGCAVAYTDKGTGNGLDDLQANLVTRIDGRLTDAQIAGTDSLFTANLTDAQRAAFNAATPNRVAYKHAHSQQNPEQDWGTNTLQAIVFAFYELNEKFGTPGPHDAKRIVLDRRNTLVIASGASNGGGAAVHAAEQDQHNLIDGVAVSEPNVNTPPDPRLTIQQGATTFPIFGRTLIDYFTYANLYQPCARMDPRAAIGPSATFLATANATNRCTTLHQAGLLAGATLADQAAEALDKLRAYGYLPESDLIQAVMYRFATNAIVVTYSNTYARTSVADNLCAFSFANTNAVGAVVAQVLASEQRIFGTGNGVPPTTGVNILYNNAVGGPTQDLLAVSPSSNLADLAADGAFCDRSLFEGKNIVTGQPLTGAAKAFSDRLLEGVGQIQLTARLKDTPAIIVQGSSDTLLPVNETSRAYYGKNQLTAIGATQLRYIEVTNGQHFDTFIDAFPGFSQLYIPLHVYLQRALNAMYDHLKNGTPLPPSQVVRTTPRGPITPPFTTVIAAPITAANVPPFSANPPAGDLILMDKTTLQIPD